MKIYFGPYPGKRSKKTERKMDIRVDGYDVWGADHTLALIIAPVLKKLKEQKHGAPYTDEEDGPEHLKDSHIPKENDYDTGLYHFERWDWILDEMIWAFETYATNWDDQFWSGESDRYFVDHEDGFATWETGPNHTLKFDYDGAKVWEDRMANGRRLFAKYYSGLWD